MSVSLALIPAAIALRAVLSEIEFQRWVRSMQVQHPTTIRDEAELARIVRAAGYDIEKAGGLNKTYLDAGRTTYFTWERIRGKWTALFTRDIPEHAAQGVMAAINDAAGQTVFPQLREPAQPGTTGQEAAGNPETFPTGFRDGELLFRALKELGANPVRQDGGISCRLADTTLVFRQFEEGSPFHVEVRNPPDMQKVFEYLAHLDDDYRRCLQEAVYNRLKARVAEQNMTIEREEVLEDNSIVLTIHVNG